MFPVFSNKNRHRKQSNKQQTVSKRPPNRAKSKFKRVHISKALREKVLHRDNYQCQGKKFGIADCDFKLTQSTKFMMMYLQVDHKIPVAKGGLTELGNLQTLCISCNRKKGAKLLPVNTRSKFGWGFWLTVSWSAFFLVLLFVIFVLVKR